jgi:8-amino-7-oxononanoate synthase
MNRSFEPNARRDPTAERTVPVMKSAPGATTNIDDRWYLYFGGTNYLGLAANPDVIAAGCDALRRYGVHSATTRAGFGHNPVTLAVEQAAARFFGCEDSFYFASGYVGNHIAIAAMRVRHDAIYLDESAHYSLVEAARGSGLPCHQFRHRAPSDLHDRLRATLPSGGRPLVLTDGVFASSGALAPLKDYLAVLREFAHASLLVDDSHGFGVLGDRGRGSLQHAGLWTDRVNRETVESESADGVGLFVVGTLAKAFGGFGGILPGSREFLAHARSSSHFYDGASAPPSAAAGSTAKAIEIVETQPELRRQLAANIEQCRGGLKCMGIDTDGWPTPIVSLHIGSAENMRSIHARLKAEGVLVPYMAAYAGVAEQGHLRCALCAAHSPEMIEQLLKALAAVV